MVEGEDIEMAKQWQKDADGILVFVGTSVSFFHTASHIKSILQTGLFSATVSVLLAATAPDPRSGPQDDSAFYLKNIYHLQILAHPTMPPPLDDQPSSSLPTYLFWINVLWFSSLITSLMCAMLATLLQQWARRYIRKTRLRKYSPHERARIRALFADGAQKLQLSMVADLVLLQLQISLFVFFIGLLIYFFHVYPTISRIATCFFWGPASAYLFVTVMPLIRCDSPYSTPLSLVIGLFQDLEKRVKTTAQGRSK
jgi:Family of unknown function (DUF6535)